MKKSINPLLLALALAVPGAAQAADTALKLAKQWQDTPSSVVSRGGGQGGLPLRGDPACHHLRAAAPV